MVPTIGRVIAVASVSRKACLQRAVRRQRQFELTQDSCRETPSRYIRVNGETGVVPFMSQA